ncbi:MULTISPECIES: tyrosine-type recombinase/integrase [Mycobacterium]|uniref:Tyrosine recombinase XerC n=1 Tax=Mycobacterium pseudokansasii TaxID=2341080 RepID=A0A498R1N4_9MYCO|nr:MULTISPECIES: site-specific integrase [Mycobacterium]UCA23009.1 site-specific integrase [Mycobacterium kansasii]VBA68775.1 Tyrosine recombinase XerC [Mycobacterium pseudokansasii]
MFLSFVGPSLVRKHLGGQVLDPAEVVRLLEDRAIPAGTPVFLDEMTMLPIEPLCSWFRHLAYDDKDAKTLHEYAYIVRRFVHFLQSRGRGLLDPTESDFQAYRVLRTQTQDKPVGDTTWAKEAQLLNQLYRWLVEHGHLGHRPLRMTRKGGNPLAPRVQRGMDIRHMTLAQYRYFRDVGLGGQLPNSQVSPVFRGRAPLRNRAAADLALSTGMRPEEWSTVLLPELGAGRRRPGEPVDFAVQACAKYGKYREIYVPTAAVDAVDNFLLIERPELVAASARSLARRRRELFVVDRVDHEAGKLRGVLDGQRRTFTMSAMEPDLRRITMQENENGVEPLAVFIGHGGQMLGPSSWYRIRCDAWERMQVHAGHPEAPVLPRRRWRWHDTRHTFALQLLSYLERQMDGDEPDAVARRRRHLAYLGGHIKHNPLLIVSRRLGHSSPASTYAYLEYTDDPMNAVDAAFSAWTVQEGDTYADIARRMLTEAGDR